MPPYRRNRLGPADDDAGLRAAEQLVAAEQDEVRARGNAGSDVRLVPQRLDARRKSEIAAAEILDDRHIQPAPEGHELAEGRALGEPSIRKFDGCTRRMSGCPFRSGGRVVGQPGAVRGADLAEARPRLRHDVGHAEAAADLDELAARDHHFASGSQRRQREQRRGGVVVHDDRGVGAGEAAEEPFGVRVAMAARAALEVVFEVGVAACDTGHACDGSLATAARVPGSCGR